MASRRKKKKTGFLPKLILIAFVVYSAVTLVTLQMKINAQKEENELIAAQIEEERIKQAQLQQENEAVVEDEYIISEAQKQGYAAPNERVFVDTSGS